MDWEELRRNEFPVADRWVYLDHAAVAPLPRRSAEMLRAWADDQAANGVVHWPEWERKLRSAKANVAELVHANSDEIAFVNSTTQGIGIVAEGFPWKEGDSVVAPLEEYSSNIYPWLNLASRGVSLRLVPTRDGRIWIDDLLAATDATTKLMTVSHVEFSSGFRNDLDTLGQDLAHSRSTSKKRPSTSSPPTVTSGSSAPRGRAFSTSAATGSSVSGQSAWAGTAWWEVSIRPKST